MKIHMYGTFSVHYLRTRFLISKKRLLGHENVQSMQVALGSRKAENRRSKAFTQCDVLKKTHTKPETMSVTKERGQWGATPPLNCLIV